VATCKVQLFRQKLIPKDNVDNEEKDVITKEVDGVVDSTSDDVPQYSGPKTRSKSVNRDIENDAIGAFWMTAEKMECFDTEYTTYVVEVLVKYHKLPEIVAEKKTEINNLNDFETFEEVKDISQKRVGSQWVITEKEKHDGQKKKYKARLVAKGFQEELKPQADSPTALRDSFKLFHAVAANEEFEIESVDIRAAFLQSRILDREVFLEPPKDLKKEGTLLKLKKPLYGLDDMSRKFWLRVREIMKKEGMKNVTGYEAFYFCYENGKLVGMILTHVDNFDISGTKAFVERITKILKKELKVSKIENNKF
jgi:hypothetical protein